MKLKATAAGTFYPGDARALGKMLDSFLSSPVRPLPGPPVGFLLPHAGYVYSGEVAAIGYRSVPRPPALVAVIGPSHSAAFEGTAVFAGDAVETPLGDVPVDRESAERLLASGAGRVTFPPAFAREHSVDVHMPLIRRLLPGASVLPLVAGQGGEKTAKELAEGLASLSRTKDLLVVASTDLCHYPSYDVAVSADREFLEAVLTGDGKKVAKCDRELMGKGWKEFHCTHCGREPLMTLLEYARLTGADKREVLAYRNSGDVTGDHDRVVGYAAVAFCR